MLGFADSDDDFTFNTTVKKAKERKNYTASTTSDKMSDT